MRISFCILFIFHFSIIQAQLSSEQCIDSTSAGKTLADFKMISNIGDTINFYDLQEEIIVFDIWATWCGPCKAQAPIYDSLRTALSSEKIKFISISIDKSYSKWKRFIKTDESTSEKNLKDHFWVGDSKEHLTFLLCHFIAEVNGQPMIGTGVPQYVIIGKNHEIILRDAPQPQSGKLDDVVKDLKDEYGF